MASFAEAYKQLNYAQKLAVDTIDGPVLVIAGPGTGKTQLLTTRIANILDKTDALPENILCLTFTDAAALTMRERLTALIGQAAYNVIISTYHAFGSDLIRHYPDYFAAEANLEPADALAIDQAVRQAQASLPYANPYKHDIFAADIKSLISDYKRALLTPDDLRAIAADNRAFLDAADHLVVKELPDFARLDKKLIPNFAALLESSAILPASSSVAQVQPLAALWQQELEEAVEATAASNKTTALTSWKNKWLVKNAAGQFVTAGRDALRRQLAMADVYEAYLRQLGVQQRYDYDDMIIRAIHALEGNAELRFTLQERYQYLLLDEFQDTNEAQLKLVQLLTDNPVNEDRPNVLAVGDDDQAIYAFQGANYSHMLEFYRHYRDVLVVPLTQNYRSGRNILKLAEGISGQINTRLHHNFPSINKALVPAGQTPQSQIYRYEFRSDLGQNAWIAKQIKSLLKQGLPAHEIAIVATKHQYLEATLPFLHQQGIAVHYEKRENILSDPFIEQLTAMSRLVQALADHDMRAADALWPQIISYPFWELPTSLIWQLSWQTSRETSWTDVLCEHDETRNLALFFMQLSLQLTLEPFSAILDQLIGITALELQEKDLPEYRSPFYDYYFDRGQAAGDSHNFWQLLSNLTVLRHHLQLHRGEEAVPARLWDFLHFIEAHQNAGVKILNTNPYQEADDAVQLLTAYRAKGQEFFAVFIIGVNDEIWGRQARTQTSRIPVPENLRFVRYAGATEDERLRLFYVALTRAKSQLYLTNYRTTFTGRLLDRLKYLDEHPNEAGELISPLLPAASQIVHAIDSEPPQLSELSLYWQDRHHQAAADPTLQKLLLERVQHLQLTATQFNRYTDVVHDGPTSFLLHDLLRFPSPGSVQASFGDAMHETLHWVYQQLVHGQTPTPRAALAVLRGHLQDYEFDEQTTVQLLDRGQVSLTAYLQQRVGAISPEDYSEYNFRDENATVGPVKIGGTIDRLIIDESAKSITVVDFKTGRSHKRWSNDVTLLRYKQQLMFYKLLVERSATFQGYTVNDAYLEFIEPDEDGVITELHLPLNHAEQGHFEKLILAVWQHIQALDFPPVHGYTPNAKGMLEFHTYLLETKP